MFVTNIHLNTPTEVPRTRKLHIVFCLGPDSHITLATSATHPATWYKPGPLPTKRLKVPQGALTSPQPHPTSTSSSQPHPTSSNKKKRPSSLVVSDSDDDQPLRSRARLQQPSKPTLQPHKPHHQPTSSSLQPVQPHQPHHQPSPSPHQPSPSPSQADLPNWNARRRPLPRVSGTPWMSGEVELREAIWEAFGRIRMMHSTIINPELRRPLQYFDSELEELLSLMGGSPNPTSS
ncbi:uncharacterized protein UTRI_10293 [Ustilago trichophora]|uniref:Uncharacterized protein n=1 Tax=Ustilago trichophora TaxID=86804 RepID=A0A5C3EP34_9BASI|nr:uncharacterized protein UTRI_10092 [Ustilago trichophora]SPO31507.1 uncharacterized protein UTRI_10293 [Ustilago trichophora]